MNSKSTNQPSVGRLQALLLALSSLLGCAQTHDLFDPSDGGGGDDSGAPTLDLGAVDGGDSPFTDLGPADGGTTPPADLGPADGGASPTCDGELSPRLCIGHVDAAPGETVDVPIELALPTGCTRTSQSGLFIVHDAALAFEVPTPVSCHSRSAADADRYYLHELTSSAALGLGCPDWLFPGVLDTITVTVPASATPGTDYPLVAEDAFVGDNTADPGCRGDTGVDGSIRIVAP